MTGPDGDKIVVEWLAALEGTALAQSLRDSVWAYPLVNAGHIAGVALQVGAIVPLDLRLLGLWPSVPLAPLWHVLTRTAGTRLLLAVVFGSLLFISRATEYAASPLFLTKMAVVAVGVANALALSRVTANGSPSSATTKAFPGRRIFAGISLAAWLTALALGRLVGYF